jgi:predicted nucleotidyltransferase
MMNEKWMQPILRNYFLNRADVAFSFLYGSYARGTAHRSSDIDIAVYFYPGVRHPIQYEEAVYYDGEDEIWADLDRLLGKEVELLVLNRVSASVAATAVRGISLAVKDWGLYLDFMEVVTREAEDFTQFMINDFLERSSV